jgi:subtilase family serine protease
MKLCFTDKFGRVFYRDPKDIENITMKTFLKPYVKPNLSSNSIATIPPQYFSGLQIKTLYNLPTITASGSSKKVTIAVIIAFTYPNLKSDLLTYWQNPINFGPNSTPPAINIYTMLGATFNSGWAQEECLDVQLVCTMNPNANIWVVEAKSDSLTDLITAVTYATNTIKSDVISMSWGTSESTSLLPYNSNFINTSVCYCAATGDNNIVSWPATNSNCIAVGGTTLIWNPITNPERTEYPCKIAGCGYSSIIKQPNYQSNITNITHNNRVIPDLSLVADMNTCVYSVYNGNWYGVGGTSVSTPIFAGILSLANQMRFNLGKSALTTVYSTNPNTVNNLINIPPINNLQNFLYKTIYPNPTQYSSIFYDIIIGSDNGSIGGNSTGTTIYNAITRYDIPTGLGSPNATNLCNSLMNI